MLNLPRPTSWYFETCRQIIWSRLSYDKLYILYSGKALVQLKAIWTAAIRRSTGEGIFVNAAEILEEKLQSDDIDWRKLSSTIEENVDVEQAVEDYFLGDDVETVVNDIEGGGYRV